MQWQAERIHFYPSSSILDDGYDDDDDADIGTHKSTEGWTIHTGNNNTSIEHQFPSSLMELLGADYDIVLAHIH